MPVVPTTSRRQLQSRGVQSAGLQTFSQPGIGNAFVRAGTEAIDVFGQEKQRANIALAQEASLNLSQISSDLLNNPETGLLNLKGKNAIGKGHEYTQQFDAQVEQLAMSLPDEQARNAFMQQAQQQRIQFTTQAGRYEIGQINAYEEGQFQATLLNNGKNAAALYGDNAAYVLANKQTFQQIEDYGIAHGWSDEQIQAKKIEFKEATAKATAQNAIGANYLQVRQQNGELSDTAAGSRRAVADSGSSDRTRGIRNNNPGNLEYSKTNPWVGQTGDDGRFAKFETPEHGIRALGRNLMSYQRQGIDTVSEIINRWAPPTDKNDTMSYIKAVCEQLGVSADEPLDASNPDTLKALCAAIIHHENGSQPYSDQQLTAGVSAALGLSQLPTKNKRYTGVAWFDALSESDQASVLRQTDALARQQQAEYKTMLDSRVRDATAAYMRGVEFPNPPGEDDFIAKPYNPMILLLHMEAVFRRASRENETILQYKELQLDLDRGSMQAGSGKTDLTKNESRILAYLIRNQGKIVCRDELIRYLWESDEFVDDNTLTVNLTRIRKKLEECGMEELIKTKRGQGYILG